MATSSTSHSSVFSSLTWTGQPVVFHERTGKNVILSIAKNNTVATKVESDDYGIVCTSEPVSIGQMFKVTVKKTQQLAEGNILYLGGLRTGLTAGRNQECSELTQRGELSWKSGDEDLLYNNGQIVYYNGKRIRKLGVYLSSLTDGQSLGMLLTRQGDLHWFVDEQWRGVVHVDGYPLDKPMWGVVDMSGLCKQVTAEICTVFKYDRSSERQLLEMGLVSPEQPRLDQPTLTPAKPQPNQAVSEDLLQQLLQEQESLRQQFQINNDQLKQLHLTRERVSNTTEIQQVRQQLIQANKQLTQSNLQHRAHQQQLTQAKVCNGALQQQVAQASLKLTQEHATISRLEQQLIQANQQLTEANRELTQKHATISRLEDQLTQANQRQQQSVSSRELEFWQVSPEEVSIREDQIIGRGGWGYVVKGTFQGTPVAVKRVYPVILQNQATLERIRREIHTMAQIRHPNLVLFIAAVLDEQTGPMIVIELLDTSLRAAYQTNRIGANKRKIFGDVSSALVYLHRQREPIIHRDVSSSNVLLASLPNHTWLAKLSDFGSANLARCATTPGEGAILYTAPEAYPQPPTSTRPHLSQTTKIDVYSFGVVACEVVTGVFPETDRFANLLSSVSRVWPQIHPLITSCVSHSPQDRPTMDTVLSQIKQLDWEPN